ncbi:uncharacterized protein FIBRA_04103 [Fibroporia radiculosa]|uniref:Uncharacterized protein n=1 Tax=Fibroporia radiculosa TaxID=599839 RepID=J4HWC6_9APHY|nr:uncharacterized protein FIBRA_04103 [Fibroporia radiculosa]CCM02027.1 predicted protein [Fibroporia radiculosa]
MNDFEDSWMTIPGAFEHNCNAEGDPPVPINVEDKLQWSLIDLERTGGFTGKIAKMLLSAGDWIDKEIEERRNTIGGIDNLWFLLTDAADFNPVCACTYTLKGKLSLEKLYSSANRQAKRFPKFRQRITSVGRRLHGARFADDPEFSLKNHIRAVSLPEPAGRVELNELMGEFIAQDWDLSRPLWEMILVENYHDEDGAQCAVITRGHHALADGQGFVISQLYITSYHDDLVHMMNSSANNLRAARRGQLPPSKIHPLLRFLDPLADNSLIGPLLQLLLALVFWFAYITSTCVSLFWSVYQGVNQATLFLLTCWRIDMLTGPQPGPRVKAREFASSRVFSISEVKLCQQAFSGPRPGSAVAGVPRDKRDKARSKAGHITLNDVVCAVMADVLGREIEAKSVGQSRGPRETVRKWLKKYLPSPIGFFIPISLRQPGDWSMRNLSTGSLVYLNPSLELTRDAPVHELHAHIHRCRAELSLLKHSLWPKLLFYIIQMTGQAPVFLRLSLLANPAQRMKTWITQWITKPLYELALQSFSVVLTKLVAISRIIHVPGPAKNPITLEGVEVLKWTALPPQAGKGTIGMGIISYAGGISIAVAADAVPASQGIARRICDGFEERFQLYVQRAREILDHID